MSRIKNCENNKYVYKLLKSRILKIYKLDNFIIFIEKICKILSDRVMLEM